MKHLESIFAAAVVGAIAFYALNQVGDKITPQDTDAIKYGATIGAVTQLAMRLTGIS